VIGLRDAIFKTIVSVAMLYLLIAGAAGIELKVHYPPYNTCKVASYGAFDRYCTTVDGVTTPAMALLKAPAAIVDYFWRALTRPDFDWRDAGFIPALALFGIPLIALALIFGLAWYPTHPIVAWGSAVLVAAEVVWDGVTGIYGIT
jgi:hypothetical protein